MPVAVCGPCPWMHRFSGICACGMSQSEKLHRLDSAYLEKLEELYSQGELPMDVHQYLALWIESQDWDRTSCDRSTASVLFQVLPANLDNQHSRFLQEGASFLVLSSIHCFKQNFQKYEENPVVLARIIRWFLYKERETFCLTPVLRRSVSLREKSAL